MSNVRAEILAASRSRTGWQDIRQTIADKRPMIDSLRLNFEDKTNTDSRKEMIGSSITTNSGNDCKSGRKLGTKVSQIANLFQSLSPPPPKEVPITNNNSNNNINNNNNVLNNCNNSLNKNFDQKSNPNSKMSSVISESKVKSNNLIENLNQKCVKNKTQIVSNGNTDKQKNGDLIKGLAEESSKSSSTNSCKSSKVSQKFESVLNKNVSPLKTGISPQIRRTESRVSRFNNAKAIFEKLQTNDNIRSDAKEADIHFNEGLICAKTSFQSNHNYIIDSVVDHNMISEETNQMSCSQSESNSESKSPNEIYNNRNTINAKISSDSNGDNCGNQVKDDSNLINCNRANYGINKRPLNLSKSVDQIEVEESPPVPLRRSTSIATQQIGSDSVKGLVMESQKTPFPTNISQTNDSNDKMICSAKEELIDKIVLEMSEDNQKEFKNENIDEKYENLPDLNSCDTSGIPDIVDFDECFHDVEMMTEEEAQKLLSRKSWQDLFTDEQLQTEMEGLLSGHNEELELKREQNCVQDLRQSDSSVLMGGETPGLRIIDNAITVSNGVTDFDEICGGEANAANDLSTTNSETSIILDDVEYHLLPDGHFYIETPGLPENSEDESEDCVSMLLCPVPPRKKSRVKFSSNPMKVYSTHSVEDYDRRNEDVDPVVASAEYELEKRIERMDVFPVEIMKGTDGLGLSIIGFVSFGPIFSIFYSNIF